MISEHVTAGSLKSVQAVNLASPQFCDWILWKLSKVFARRSGQVGAKGQKFI